MSLGERITEYLTRVNQSKSPTDIGIALGYPEKNASAYMAHAIKQLLKDGKIEQKKIDGRIRYRMSRPTD